MGRVNSLKKTLTLRKTDSNRKKGATKDRMVEWYYQVNGHGFEQTVGDSEAQGNLACCSPWGFQRVGHNLVTEQQQESQPTPGFFPGKFHGQRSLADYSPHSHKRVRHDLMTKQ